MEILSAVKEEKKYREYTISIGRANLVAAFFIVPILVFMVLPYFLIWHRNIFSIPGRTWWIFLVTLPVGAVVHELLHGMVWALFVEGGFRSISFGVKLEYLTPYCHCNKPMAVWQYFIGAMMPLLVMGIIPWIWGTIRGNEMLVFFALFYTWAAGGDIQAMWMLRKFRVGDKVEDHPEELGFIIYDY